MPEQQRLDEAIGILRDHVEVFNNCDSTIHNKLCPLCMDRCFQSLILSVFSLSCLLVSVFIFVHGCIIFACLCCVTLGYYYSRLHSSFGA